MADFVKDLFDGSAGLLTGHAPDVGTWQRPEIDLDDGGGFANATANPAAATLYISGSGGMLFDASLAGDYVPILKSGTTAPQANVFAEAIVECEPSTTDVEILVAMRATTMVAFAWPNAINFVGCSLQFFTAGAAQIRTWYASDGGFGSSTVYTTPTIYGTGRFTFTLRMELVGGIRTLYLNGVEVFSDNVSAEPNLLVAGDTYFAINYFDAPLTGVFYNAPILSLRAGTMPETIEFWENEVLCEEAQT